MTAWPRLAEILPALPEDRRRRLAQALGLPGTGPAWQQLYDLLVDDRLVRRLIRSLADRATRSLRLILAHGAIPSPGTPGLDALAKAGLVLPTPAGPAFPLEFAFAAPEHLPDESLLRLIARANLDELERWLDDLRSILGPTERYGRSSLLVRAADVYAILTANAERLVSGLDEAARAALEEFGPMDGLAKRRSFLAGHAPGLPDGPWLPYRIPEDCPERLRQLLLRGLIAPSGSAWQPGIYFYLPLEMRPAALGRYYRQMEARAEAVLAMAGQIAYQPGENRTNRDGPALLRHTSGALASAPLHLTQKGLLVQADLERLAKVLGIPVSQAEAPVLLALGLGLAALKDNLLTAAQRKVWPVTPLPARRALGNLTLRRPGRTPPAEEAPDFLSFLRLAVLEGLAQAATWLTVAHLQDLLLTRPDLGRWLEYFWGREEPGKPLALAITRTLEVLGALGAVEIDLGEQGDYRAVRILPWGVSLLADEVGLPWPPPEPLVVTANHEVYAPLGLGPAVLARLGRLADLVNAGPAMVFRLSRESLWRAAAGGVKIGEELAWLASQARGGLPQNVAENLAEIAGRQGEVRLAPAGGYLVARNPSLLASLRQSPALAPLVLAEAGGLLILAPGVDLERVERDLARLGLLVERPAREPGKPSNPVISDFESERRT